MLEYHKGVQITGIIGFIFGSIMALVLVGLVFNTSLSVIENLSEFSADYVGGEERKIAGSFRLMNQGDEFGSVEKSRLENLKRKYSSGQCGSSIAGFGEDERLRLKIGSDSCGATFKPVTTMIYESSGGGGKFKSADVGGIQ